jgi:hypothetical protein
MFDPIESDQKLKAEKNRNKFEEKSQRPHHM